MAAVAELKFRRGAILEQHLTDGAGAVLSYREALTLEPSHVGARTALQAYLSSADPELQQAAVQELEPIYESTNDLARLVEVQRIKLSHEKKTDKRVELLLRIGKLEGQLGNADQAWEAYTRAFSESPSSSAARESLENLANILDNWQPLVTLYEKALSAKGKEKLPSALERELLLVVAVAYDEKLGHNERAVEYFRRAQSIQPEDASALVALERLYTRTERWSDLVDTLLKKAQLVTDAAEREEIRIRIATVWEEMLANAEQAIVAWNVVLQDNPSNVRALRSLDRLYLARGEFRELADNLQRQLSLAEDDGAETVTLLGRLGALRELKLDQLGAAVDTYSKILKLEPEHRETIAALERILLDEGHELDAALLLEPIYKIRGDWNRLIGVYEVEARHAADPEQKIALYRQIADGYEVGLDDPGRAYEALARALAEDPQHAEVQTAVERLARALDKLDDLVARYGRLVTGVSDPERKNALYHKIARLCEVDLGDDQQAAAAYGAALEVWPRDLDAANALEQLYLRGGDYANLVQLLQRKAEIVEGAAEKKALYYRAAQLYEEVLEDLESSVKVFQHVLSVDDADGAALDQLERLYIRLGRWNDLKNIYAKKAELAATPAEKKQMLFVLGQVYDRELGDPERAVETYSSIIDLDPEDYDAAQALDRLYQQLERWYDLLAVLERQTEMAPSPAEVVSLRFRIGELWREHLKDLARAVEAYRQVLSDGPRARADGPRAGSAHVGRRGRVVGAGGPGAGADLRERRRVGSGHRRLRGDAGAGRGARPQGGAAGPDGGDRGAAPLASERGVRHLRARAARRSDQPGHPVPARSAGVGNGALGQARPPCSRPSWTRSTIRTSRSISSCASGASTKRRPTSPRRPSPPTARRWRRTARASRPSSRSIVCTAAPSSGTSWRPSCAARSASLPPTTSGSR